MIYTVWYNFAEVHKTLRMTPAMAAGVSNRLMSMEDVAALVEAAAATAGPRGPYRKAIRNETLLDVSCNI
jgi:hypothetical protein